ncbi:MAG: cytochrome c class [Paenibacillus sp.]|nr:cytochrome c class [Paenibacillus sp.]
MVHTRGIVAAAVLLTAAMAVLAGCGSKDGGSKQAGGGAEALYKQRCLSCHGERLEGRVGPGTNLTQVGGKLTREQIMRQITEGGNGMPGFKSSMSEAEIGTLADWLAAKK